MVYKRRPLYFKDSSLVMYLRFLLNVHESFYFRVINFSVQFYADFYTYFLEKDMVKRVIRTLPQLFKAQ